MNRSGEVQFVGSVLLGALSRRVASVVRADAALTTRSKIVLLTSEGTARARVRVETENGHVTLQGRVGSAQARGDAERAVRDVSGVTAVNNLLKVAPGLEPAVLPRSDPDVRAAVEAALGAHWNFGGIVVGGVSEGQVLLEGTTGSFAEVLRGLEAAYGCSGVRLVRSRVAVEES